MFRKRCQMQYVSLPSCFTETGIYVDIITHLIRYFIIPKITIFLKLKSNHTKIASRSNLPENDSRKS